MKKMGIPPALIYIRKNVTLKRVKRVEKFLEDGRMFDVITETVYRGYKGSYKIQFTKAICIKLVRLIIYLLFGEPEVSDDFTGIDLKKYFRKDSTFVTVTKKYDEVPVGRELKSGWIDISECMFPLMGGELFYYCILKSLLKIAKKALKDKKYSYEVMNWDEAICEYVIFDVRKNVL